MDVEKIKELMQAVSENGLTEFSYQDEDISLKIKKEDKNRQKVPFADGPRHCPPGSMMPPPPGPGPGGYYREAPPADRGGAVRPPVPEMYAPGPQGYAPDAAQDVPDREGNVVTCPLVGTFFAAASPDEEPFVQVGDTVKKGQVLCIVEAMKLMNEIESEYDGVVKAILAKNGDLVEYGQELFVIG